MLSVRQPLEVFRHVEEASADVAVQISVTLQGDPGARRDDVDLVAASPQRCRVRPLYRTLDAHIQFRGVATGSSNGSAAAH